MVMRAFFAGFLFLIGSGTCVEALEFNSRFISCSATNINEDESGININSAGESAGSVEVVIAKNGKTTTYAGSGTATATSHSTRKRIGSLAFTIGPFGCKFVLPASVKLLGYECSRNGEVSAHCLVCYTKSSLRSKNSDEKCFDTHGSLRKLG
jgi:hypothetical protein